MHKFILLATVAALAGCQQKAAAPANDANMATAETPAAAPAATPAALQINETSWEYTDNKTGKPIQESIDATGKYISVSGKEHIDHGTALIKGDKACFTSAMTKDGEVCWTDPKVAVGQAGETTSDKGEKLTVKRVAYVALTM
jgi:hypothetical protein